MSSLARELDSVEERLRAEGIECARERFRLPSRPQLSPSAGFLACAAGGFLLIGGNAAASFLAAVGGAVLLLLDAYGFSPVAWLGPKETRSVLVVWGTPSDRKRKALFFGIPLRCRMTGSGYFSREETIRRAASAGGLILAFLFCAVSGGVLLVVLPPLPLVGALTGTAMTVFAAREWARPLPQRDGPPNQSVSWVSRLAAARGADFRPFLLVYSGDGAEVKYFLARHRGPLFRGYGVFLEFARDAEGPPAASVAEGPFLPYRVDPALLFLVRESGKAHGIPPARDIVLRERSPGLFAMARGFRAVTLFRLEKSFVEEVPFPAEKAAGWAERIADSSAAGIDGKG